MADDPFDFINTSKWSASERELYAGAFEGTDHFIDPVAGALFHEGFFNFDRSSDEINAIRNTLNDYLYAEYGVDFNEVFDWEAYRAAYAEM